jgi:hypothetical protein
VGAKDFERRANFVSPSQPLSTQAQSNQLDCQLIATASCQMKLFLSWSGALSKSVAELLGDWLKSVIQALEPFVSTDIAKGDAWFLGLLEELNASKIGVICVTRANLHSDWLHFEAGALAKQVGRPRVCTLLIDVSPLEVPAPLSGFQATTLKRDDVLRLIKAIHQWTQPSTLTEKQLEQQFGRVWAEFESQVRAEIAASQRTQSSGVSLAEGLLLPMIHREINSGQLEQVFDVLAKAKEQGIAGYESRLGSTEGILSRVAGKRGAEYTLKQVSARSDDDGARALIELRFLQFAARVRIHDLALSREAIDALPESLGLVLSSVLAVWFLREGLLEEARQFYERARPESIADDPYDHYRGLFLGIASFGLGNVDLGERHFDLIREGLSRPHEGYPYVSLVAPLNRIFVNVCVGQGDRAPKSEQIRLARGHAWVIVEASHYMRRSEATLANFASIGRKWSRPLTAEAIASRLAAFERSLVAAAGPPMMS